MQRKHALAAFAGLLTLALTPALVAADGKPMMLEDVPGSPVKRITLTAKAVQRLGIEVGKVSEEIIVRHQVVGGVVIAPTQVKRPQPSDAGFGGFGAPAPTLQPVAQAKTASADGTWVLLTLSPGEWERLAKDKPARLMPLATRQPLGKPIAARPAGMPPVEDPKRSMLNVYYVVPDDGPGLEHNQRMRVELELAGSGEKKKVVPYSAVYYDAKGTPWVYLNPEPRVYQRSRVAVERIAGELAVLKDGPEVGTTIVTVGAPLLFGTEIFKK